MNKSCIVIGFKDDSLLWAVVSRLKAQNVDVIWRNPNSLADTVITIDGETLYIDEQAIGGIFFRCPINESFSQSFEPSDQYFANVEIRSIWLAALHLSSVRIVNQFDSVVWFEDTNWLVTRRWLMHHGIQVSPFTFGNIPPRDSLEGYTQQIQILQTKLRSSLQGLTAASFSRCVVSDTYISVCGKIIGTVDIPEIVVHTQEILVRKGIRFAELILDQDGHLFYVNMLPNLNSGQISQASEIIARFYCDDLHFR